ncbi:MAG: formylglycine-generating enzyme family protein, partial [Caldilineaceae bacterium]
GACSTPRRFNSYARDHYFYNPDYDFYPVLYVSWWDARAYCEWTGKRLPTEAEWEKAARGPGDTRVWPWGNERIDCSRANYTEDSTASWDTCVNDTEWVGSFALGASPYGVMDMSGNVFEWVHDKWDTTYYSRSPYANPQGPDDAEMHGEWFGIRGGSYRPRWWYPRTFNRHFGHHGDGVGDDRPNYRNDQVGFRCADAP